ncbi:MAG: hypothetical protein Q8Q31_01670 [Nanoarchaeota archaeon]|nr:hypothetical protein [Nanoarchaeota archaeon]
MNKRGMSEIVSTVLIILLTIAGVALVASIIVPYVNNKLSSGSECVAYNTGYFEFEDDLDNSNYNCYQTIAGDPLDPTSQTIRRYGFSIKTGESEELISEKVAGLNLIFTGDVSSTTLNINNSQKDVRVKELGSIAGADYSLLSDGETITYVYTEVFPASESRQIYNRADTYVVLKSGKVCDISDSIPIKQCLPGTTLT